MLTGLILQEILQAFRCDATFRMVMQLLEPFPLLELTRADYVAAAQIRRSCASHGISASTVDCQIAAAAIQNDCLLITADKDFILIAQHVPLRLT